ncbi:MAG: alanine--tRNA ligase [Bacteroidota bacterium]
MDSSNVRQTFLDFFRSKQHHIVPSASMVIKDDPTLMFTNAGMNQFKDIFLGNKEATSRRIADTQKCLRVSGKHNDLEEVGHDTYHHTMFEMLGNWSFGDYFKKEAIEWAWELLTGIYQIDKERLYVTVFEGDKTDSLKADADSLTYWKALVPEERILFGTKKDNFWEMGDTGPCGPCSEIHIDLRPEKERRALSGRELVNSGNPLVIEIWNLVFIEFNRQTDGKLIPLPAKHVDTGMGFERLCMVLQKKVSNYDTDVFLPLIKALSHMSEINYGSDPKADVAMRVVADHLRAIAFAIADGQLPSNVKAGYVIRRILRRAVRFGYVFLHFREPFICEMVRVLSEQMGKFFPELISQQQLIENVIREEETSFLRTLEQGIQKFQQYTDVRSQMPDAGKKDHLAGIRDPEPEVIEGAFAFELYDTYGFPIDLTELMAREIGWTVDMEGFREGMAKQKDRSRQAAILDTSDWMVLKEDTGVTKFVGYDELQTETLITRYRKVSGKGGDRYQVVLQSTPFFAESGGQVGDQGWLKKGKEKIEIIDTVREHEQIIHITSRFFSDPDGTVIAEVDGSKRLLTANNHTATHLLHAALRKVLGTQVEQKGSLVDETRLRFDFTHFSKVTPEQIVQVEKLVNARIRENILQLEERAVPMARAREMGAIALFGEKYGDDVRVIRFGEDFSTELCGGTHVPSTGQIGLFRIISEGAIAAGIRRVEAITGTLAEEYMYGREQLLDQVSEALKNPRDPMYGIRHLQDENQQLKKAAGEYGKLKQAQIKEELKNSVETIGDFKFLGVKVNLDMDTMKGVAFELRDEIPGLFLVLASESDGKVNLVVAISDALVKEKNLHAGQLIRELAKEIQGGGGGQPHIATAGGKDPAAIPALLEKAKKMAY